MRDLDIYLIERVVGIHEKIGRTSCLVARSKGSVLRDSYTKNRDMHSLMKVRVRSAVMSKVCCMREQRPEALVSFPNSLASKHLTNYLQHSSQFLHEHPSNATIPTHLLSVSATLAKSGNSNVLAQLRRKIQLRKSCKSSATASRKWKSGRSGGKRLKTNLAEYGWTVA